MASQKWRAVELTMFALLLAVLVAPVWSVRAFLTQDGPSHVYNAFVLFHLNEPPFRDSFTLGSFLQPNWLSHILLGGLLQFLSPTSAEKIVVTACLVLVPLAFRHLLASLAPNAPRTLSWASIPFASSHALYMGFWNFCLGYGVLFIALSQFSRHRGAAFGAMALLLAFCHPVPFVVLLLIIGTLVTVEVAVLGPATLRRFHIVLWSTPAVMLFVISSVQRGGGYVWRPFRYALRDLITMWPLVVHRRVEQWPAAAIALAIAIGVIGALRMRRYRQQVDGWLLAAVLMLLAYLIAPDATSGGDHISERLLLFPWPLAVLWIGLATPQNRTPMWLGPTVAAAALSLIVLRWPMQRRIDDMLLEYRAPAATVPARHSILSISLLNTGRETSLTVRPFLHAIGYDAVDRRLLDLGDYEARTTHFPIVARSATFAALARFAPIELPGTVCVDLGQPTDVRPDAVLVFGGSQTRTLCGTLQDELSQQYEIAHADNNHRAVLFLRPELR